MQHVTSRCGALIERAFEDRDAKQEQESVNATESVPYVLDLTSWLQKRERESKAISITLNMPPKKEPKETVVYPASKRKAPPFKPQRPSKVQRLQTSGAPSTKAKTITKATLPLKRKPSQERDDSEEETSDVQRRTARVSSDGSESDEELEENPLTINRKSTARANKPTRQHTRVPSLQSSPQSFSSCSSPNTQRGHPQSTADKPPAPSQLEDGPIIPQPLLVRLLHEHFVDKDTKIDKQAIQVLQKYFEVFVRETIARVVLRKREDAEKGGDNPLEADWLELEDLEKVAASMLLDF